MTAIQESPLSLTIPYLAFTPAFMIFTGYMISVKRLSALIGIIYGRLFFKEKHIAMRLVGAGLMLAGAVLITVWGK